MQAIIESLEIHLPERIVTNEELAGRLGKWTAEEIFRKTGMRERRFAARDECSSDLAIAAARKLIAGGRLNPSDVDYILFCTQSPDYFLPQTAPIIQDRLGLPRTCGSLDFNHGCAGFVAGLSIAKGLIASSQARCVLFLTGETYSKFINPKDGSVATLFGDAGSATVVRACDTNTPAGIGEFVFGSDGRGAKNLIVPAGALRKPRSEATAIEATDSDGNTRSENDLYMNGRDVFRFAIVEVPKTVKALLEKARQTPDDIDYLILHQANRYMLDQLAQRLPVPKEKIPYEFEDVGNTVSCTIPITLHRLQGRGELRSGSRLLLVGFGVGYSWAACTLTWA